MPAKSQFDVVELVKKNGQDTLIVGGDIGLEAGARNVPPSHLHVVVIKDGRLFKHDGPSNAGDPKKWGFEIPAAGITPGPAVVFGLTVQFDEVRDGAAFETFAWTQQVTIEQRGAAPAP